RLRAASGPGAAGRSHLGSLPGAARCGRALPSRRRPCHPGDLRDGRRRGRPADGGTRSSGARDGALRLLGTAARAGGPPKGMMNKAGAPMISVEEALRAVLDATPILPFESVDLPSALGRVLAEEVHADSDQPPFDKAMMDGYALCSEDLRATPTELQIVME